ncbi:PREDICTED: protein S100-A13 isoform X1 [Condylura cristata]|uniref:protein S100-A13 isoform X1 n=1 Tax=Condylura cristata TaxID=143302 RepID=UPI000643A4B1|nr:PREDICTED: protein S100-A13 isoform X1 [Condylura cristata]
MAAEPLTELEAAIETVVTTFFTFAGREGRKGSLSINEFKELVAQQLPHLLKAIVRAFVEGLLEIQRPRHSSDLVASDLTGEIRSRRVMEIADVVSLDEKMKSLDVNQDSELKFNEYWRLIGELAKEIRKEKAQEIRKK